MEKEKIINEILEKEWKYFSNLNNIGGRADCQDNREDFIIMRKSQWETFNEETLLSYLEDLNSKNNPLFQKYAQMMKYNSPEEYEKIKDILEKASDEKTDLVNKIMFIYMEWEKEFFERYPIFSSMGRPLYSSEDDNIETSIETYLRGELLSYSEKTLKLYLNYVIDNKEKNIPPALKEATIGLTLYNLFSSKYDNNGWAAPQYRLDGSKLVAQNTWGTRDSDAAGFAPSAPFHFMARLAVTF